MPYILVQVTDEGVTREQKAKIIAGATDLMVDVIRTRPSWSSMKSTPTTGAAPAKS
jgi:4-oxalocrotonate tautomerase family enzyme